LIPFDRFVELIACRDLKKLLESALRVVSECFNARGGSLLFLGGPKIHIKQGEFDPDAEEQISLWEKSIEERLSTISLKIKMPQPSLIASRTLPRSGFNLLNTPILSDVRVVGSLSLILERELTLPERQMLIRFLTGVGNLTELIGELVLTKQRLTQLGLFYEIGQTMLSTFDLEKVLEDTMQLATIVVGATTSVLMFVDEEKKELVFEVTYGEKGEALRRIRTSIDEGIAGWVATHGEPVIVNDVSQDPRFSEKVDVRTGFLTRSVLCVPLQVKGRTIGVLEVLNKLSEEGFDEEDLRMIMTLAIQAAIAIENARLYQSLREERDRIIKAQEDVRHELARNLHDRTIQQLAGIAMSLDYIERLLKFKPEAVYAELSELKKRTRRATREARMLLFELHPAILETKGLVPALEFYVKQLRESESFSVHFEADSIPRLDTKVAGTIFSIVQEAITNTKKHAKASNVWLTLREEEGEIVVNVKDDGIGFDVETVEREYEKRGSFGLLSMKERAELIESSLSIESSQTPPNRGTSITLRVPLFPPQSFK
jgi:signal transduction histidine kinase